MHGLQLDQEEMNRKAPQGAPARFAPTPIITGQIALLNPPGSHFFHSPREKSQ